MCGGSINCSRRRREDAMLWEVDVHPAQGQSNRGAVRMAAEAVDIGLPSSISVDAAHGFLIEGDLSHGKGSTDWRWSC